MATSMNIPVQTLRSLRGVFLVEMSSRGWYNRSSNQTCSDKLRSILHFMCRQTIDNTGNTTKNEDKPRYDKTAVCLPRQGIPFRLRPLYLLDFREIRIEIWDTFGTIEDCDIAQTTGAIS